jgi:hypothetical protein
MHRFHRPLARALCWVSYALLAPLAVSLNVAIVVGALGSALYGACWLMFIGGITDALNMLKSDELLSMGDVAIALIKLLGAAPVASVLVYGGIALALAIWASVEELRPR